MVYVGILLLMTIGCKTDENLIQKTQPKEEFSYPELPDLDTFITEEMNNAKVPGLSACIIRNEDILWCNGYGYANIEEDRLVDSTTPFMLASVSKTFVSAAAMILVERGQLDLDAHINSILDFPVHHPHGNTDISTRMLLSHTAGIKDNWTVMGSVIVDGDSPIALGDFLEDYLTEQGSYYSSQNNFINEGVLQSRTYSNIGVALAAYVIEKAADIPFDSFCEDNIFEPLQMHDTSWHLEGLDLDLVAVPYRWRMGDWRAIEHYGYPDYPDGSLRTGAEQLARFLVMHSNGGHYRDTKIISEDSIAELNTAHYPSLDSGQGLIWYEWTLNGQRIRGHNGGDSGVSTEIGVREDGTGFVILMNSSGEGNILRNIEEALLNTADQL
ncbi:MAG: hypothetical protein CMK59_10230 [Proteobacteria bacterium]|nr:hypothetical protein [Pseudomonadota bacterium]